MSTMSEFDYVDLIDPCPLDVAPLYAIMVWPDDAGARERWLAASILGAAGPAAVAQLGVDERRNIEEQRARYGDDISDLVKQIPKRRLMGKIVGLLTLAPAVLSRIAPDASSITALQERISSELSNIDPELGPMYTIGVRTMKNKAGPVQPFRPVAHFWAAHQLWLQQGETEFPCSDEMLPAFIASAEEIRNVAEQAHTPQSPTTVMRPGEAVDLPERLKAQLSELNIEVDLAIPPRFRVV
jgi:hypothetical protein